jgi:uncharacterized protein YjbJ (UPF0337 family)
MNEDTLKNQWPQLRGQIKQWWSLLTDDDLNKINGRRDQLIGKLQERYGYTKEQANRQIDEHLTEFQHTVPMSR